MDHDIDVKEPCGGCFGVVRVLANISTNVPRSFLEAIAVFSNRTAFAIRDIKGHSLGVHEEGRWWMPYDQRAYDAVQLRLSHCGEIRVNK